MSAIIDLPIALAIISLILLGIAAATVGADSRQDFGDLRR
jgi:hypothetical protein